MLVRKSEFIHVCQKILIIKTLEVTRLTVRENEYNNCFITNLAFKTYC